MPVHGLFQQVPNGRVFTFLEHEGVEPTNNSVERALRTGVHWPKGLRNNNSSVVI